MFDTNLSVVWTAVPIAVSTIAYYCLMALRKPRPISNEINFDEQSVDKEVKPDIFLPHYNQWLCCKGGAPRPQIKNL